MHDGRSRGAGSGDGKKSSITITKLFRNQDQAIAGSQSQLVENTPLDHPLRAATELNLTFTHFFILNLKNLF